MEKILLFISGPISGYDRQERKEIFSRTQTHLRKLYPDWTIINPMDVAFMMGDDESPEEDINEMVLEILKQCSVIYMMDGWEKSERCVAELSIAINEYKGLLFEYVLPDVDAYGMPTGDVEFEAREYLFSTDKSVCTIEDRDLVAKFYRGER